MTVDVKSRHRTKSGDNVFLDLGFPPREATRLLAHADVRIDESIRLKRQLMDQIAEWMRESSVTQAAAAQVLHVTRPRVSDVVNHKVEKFTIDALVDMLSRIGKQVRLAGNMTITRTPIHPGEILAEELLELGINATELSRQIRVPANRISQIISGKRAVTGDTALRLAHWFGTSPQFWMNLQTLYDVRMAEQGAGKEIRSLPKKPAKPKIDRSRSA